MRVVLVGKRKGNRVFNWPGVLSVGLIVGIVCGASGAATWFLLTGEFGLHEVFLPVFAAIGVFAGIAIRSYISTPLEQLSDLD